MALPTLTCTWRFRVNHLIPAAGGAGNSNTDTLIAILDALLGNGSWTDSEGAPAAVVNPWTVVASNGRLTGPVTGTNVLTTAAELIWTASGNRFWIVLQNVDGVQVLIASPGNSSNYSIYLAFSTGGLFTGGTATTLPTATDAVLWGSNGTLQYNGSGNRYMHVLHSTDGRETRVFVCEGGLCPISLTLGRLASPKPAVASPFWLAGGGIGALATNDFPITQYTSVSGASVWMRHAGLAARMFFGSIGGATSLLATHGSTDEFETAPDLWAIDPIVLCGYATTGARGRAGVVRDFWLASSGRATGDQYPLTGGTPRQFTQFGNLLVPWNKTFAVVS